jgi:FG-GAP repeat
MKMLIRTAVIATSTFFSVSGAQVINEDFKITASDREAGDLFGYSVAIDNGVVAVGVPLDDDNGDDSGSAYVFDISTGKQLFKFIPSDGALGDQFGTSIAIDDGVIAVGADHDDKPGFNSGSAYLFDASTGEQLFKLVPNDSTADDRFGVSIAIDNGVVAVGAFMDDENGTNSGSAYLFDASTGMQITKIVPSDGMTNALFGNTIAIDNGIVAVGATFDSGNGQNSGSAYLFDATTGTQIIELQPIDIADGFQFGYSIALNNGVVTVGAVNSDDQSGSAYLFDASNGQQLAKLLPNDGAMGDLFGCSIAIENDIVAVGAFSDDDNGSNSGSAYLFDAFTGTQITKIVPSDGSEGVSFGIPIAIDKGVVAVGAIYDDDKGIDSGSAYLFDTSSEPCLADLTGEGKLNFFDVSVFLTFFQLNDPIADFTGDDQFNFFDVSEFLNAYAEGCP